MPLPTWIRSVCMEMRLDVIMTGSTEGPPSKREVIVYLFISYYSTHKVLLLIVKLLLGGKAGRV